VTGNGHLPTTSTDMKDKRREIIKEWIDSGRIKDINSNLSSDEEVFFYPEGEE